jgi:hypothetical protein
MQIISLNKKGDISLNKKGDISHNKKGDYFRDWALRTKSSNIMQLKALETSKGPIIFIQQMPGLTSSLKKP